MTLSVHAWVGNKITISAKLLNIMYESYRFNTDLIEGINCKRDINVVRLVSTGIITGFIVTCKDSQ